MSSTKLNEKRDDMKKAYKKKKYGGYVELFMAFQRSAKLAKG